MDQGLLQRFGKEFEQDSMIFCEFEIGNDFYLIQTGKVRISKIVNNREKIMDILGPGDIFGEMAILEKQPRSATAVAITKVISLHFNRENFVSLMNSQPPLAFKLMVIFSKRIYDAKKRALILLLDDVQAKVASVLLMLAEKDIGSIYSQRELSLSTTADDIANWCAESTESVQSVLDLWSKMGKIDLYTDKVMVYNVNDLNRIISTRKQISKS